MKALPDAETQSGNRFFQAIFFIILFVPLMLYAQEDFGFGDSDSFGFPGGASSGFSVNIGGEVNSELTFFYDDCGSPEKIKNAHLGDIFSGSLNFSAGSSAAEAVINLNLSPVFDGSPITIDEAFGRAFFGPVTIEGGLRKLTWGKADSFGHLDVINPLDYTDLTQLSDPKSVKIARPMIHGTVSLGSFTKMEAVFIPWFQGHTFAASGRWAPRQISDMKTNLGSIAEQTLTETGQGILISGLPPMIISALMVDLEENRRTLESSIDNLAVYPEADTFKYAQAGMRFTTSLGSSDLGFQYYFGRFPRPKVSGINPFDFFNMATGDFHPEALMPDIDYNYYHQIAADFARVVAGFNLRAEAGVNLTKDLDGTDPAVENPAFVWSLGFDRDLFAGINLNLQGNGKIRLFYSKISDDFPLDCEAGTDASSTRITGILSRKFLRDELELKLSGLWGIEDKDFLLMPSIGWTRNDVSAKISAGFFGGDKNGELGQYKDNGFLKLTLGYTF